jgi:predicted small secreted protein
MLSRSPLALSALLLAAAMPLAACNSLTGVDDLVVGGGPLGSGGDSSSAASGGVGGAGSTSDVGVGVGVTTGTGIPMPPTGVPAQGVSITEIAVYQGVKADVMKNGATVTSKVPIVANRDALFRVFTKVDGTYDKSPVTGLLYLGDSTMPIKVSRVASASTDGSLNTTFNFDVPAASMAPGLQFRVELQQPPAHSSGMNTGATYPAMGSAPLNVQSTGKSLRIKIVPIKYGGDGSGRLPDTSPTQIQAYKDEFYKIYPIAAADITVRAAFPWNSSVDPNGNGWGELLDAIGNLRQQDGASPDLYYFGAFSPSQNEGQYCGGGCVAGLGMIGSPGDSYSRAAIGLGFGGSISTETAVHEIGHNHGRQHSPCGGAQGVDPGYPYPNAAIGVWGYDLLTKQLQDPNQATDLMGYCQPIWVSDYTYEAFFARVKQVNNAKIIYPVELLDRTYDRARVDGEGNLTWMREITLHEPPMAEEKAITVQSASGPESVQAQFYPYDHLPGGVLVWPQGQAPAAGIQMMHDGVVKTLVH